MTRFRKEIKKRYPGFFGKEKETGEELTFTVDREALIVTDFPSICFLHRFTRDGKLEEVEEYEYPEITSAFLVHLCGGDVEEARRILKSQSGLT